LNKGVQNTGTTTISYRTAKGLEKLLFGVAQEVYLRGSPVGIGHLSIEEEFKAIFSFFEDLGMERQEIIKELKDYGLTSGPSGYVSWSDFLIYLTGYRCHELKEDGTMVRVGAGASEPKEEEKKEETKPLQVVEPKNEQEQENDPQKGVSRTISQRRDRLKQLQQRYGVGGRFDVLKEGKPPFPEPEKEGDS
jgi:hypothetical protein